MASVSKLKKLPPLPKIKLGLYQHYKGSTHKVIGIARHSETLEPLVVYTHGKNLWTRPVKMFLEKVLVDGKKVSRFAFLKK